MEHRQPTEEFLFYQAVSSGDVEAVKNNCRQERFLDSDGVGVKRKEPINLEFTRKIGS